MHLSDVADRVMSLVRRADNMRTAESPASFQREAALARAGLIKAMSLKGRTGLAFCERRLERQMHYWNRNGLLWRQSL